MEAVIFIGIQASGKTSFYRERFSDTHVRISLDMLRTRRREQALVEACLAVGQRFVVDNTNPTAADRQRYIGPARQARFRVIGYFFEPVPGLCATRNERREGRAKVPPAALFGTLKRLECPTLDEGFDELWVVRARRGKFELEAWRDEGMRG